jgi:hypothetical protein
MSTTAIEVLCRFRGDIVKSIRWKTAILAVMVLLLAACGPPAVTPQPTPVPLPPALLGYVGQPPDSPAVFVRVEQGMFIEISDASYDPDSQRLAGYTARISYPSGDHLEMAFVDIRQDESGAVAGFNVRADGGLREGPPPDVFVTQFAGALGERKMAAFAPPWKAQQQEPAAQIFICPGIMAINYDMFDGNELVTRQEIYCEGESYAYAFDFDDYTFAPDSTLVGFTVRLEVQPRQQE